MAMIWLSYRTFGLSLERKHSNMDSSMPPVPLANSKMITIRKTATTTTMAKLRPRLSVYWLGFKTVWTTKLMNKMMTM